MIGQVAKLGAVALVAGLLGWTVGRSTPLSAPASSDGAATAANLTAPDAAGSTHEDCVCGAEREHLLAAAQHARRMAYTGGLTWPDDAGDHARAVVDSTLKAAIAECGEGVELESLDCEEPPCIAVIRAGDDGWADAGRLQNCPPWHDRYGEDVAVSMKSEHCDGEVVNKVFLAPSWPLELTPTVSLDQYRKRLGERLQRHRNAVCP